MLHMVATQPESDIFPVLHPCPHPRYRHDHAVAMEGWLDRELMLDRAEHPAIVDPANPAVQLHPAGSNWSALVEMYMSQLVWLAASDIALKGWAFDEMFAADTQLCTIFDQGFHPKYNLRSGLRPGAAATQSQAHNEFVAATLGSPLVDDGSPMPPDAVQEEIVCAGKDMLPDNVTADTVAEAAEVALLNVDLRLLHRQMVADKRGAVRSADASVSKSIVAEVSAALRLFAVAGVAARPNGGPGLAHSGILAAVTAEHASFGPHSGFTGKDAEDVLKSRGLAPQDGVFGPILGCNPQGCYWFNGEGVGGRNPAELLGAVIKMSSVQGTASVTGYCPVKGPRPTSDSELWLSAGGAGGRNPADITVSMASTNVANLVWTNGTQQQLGQSGRPVRVKVCGWPDEYVLLDVYRTVDGPGAPADRLTGRALKASAQALLGIATAVTKKSMVTLHLRALIPLDRQTETGLLCMRTFRSVLDLPPGSQPGWRCTMFQPVAFKDGGPVQRADKAKATVAVAVKREAKHRAKCRTAATATLGTNAPPADPRPLRVPPVRNTMFESVMSAFATSANDKMSDNSVVGGEIKSAGKQASTKCARTPSLGKALRAPGEFDCFEEVTVGSRSKALAALVRLNKPGGPNDMERTLNRVAAGTLTIPVRAGPQDPTAGGLQGAPVDGGAGAGAATVTEQAARFRAHQDAVKKVVMARKRHLKAEMMQQRAASETFADGASAAVHTAALFLSRALRSSKATLEQAIAAERAAMALVEGGANRK